MQVSFEEGKEREVDKEEERQIILTS